MSAGGHEGVTGVSAVSIVSAFLFTGDHIDVVAWVFAANEYEIIKHEKPIMLDRVPRNWNFQDTLICFTWSVEWLCMLDLIS